MQDGPAHPSEKAGRWLHRSGYHRVRDINRMILDCKLRFGHFKATLIKIDKATGIRLICRRLDFSRNAAIELIGHFRIGAGYAPGLDSGSGDHHLPLMALVGIDPAGNIDEMLRHSVFHILAERSDATLRHSTFLVRYSAVLNL